MSKDIHKHLLSQFYGFNENSKETRFLSSSKGIESFENLTDVECLSSDHLISSEETAKNQNIEEDSENLYEESRENNSSKSPHVLKVEDLVVEDDEDKIIDTPSQFEADIIDDFKDDKNVPTKNFTRLEDTFTKAIAKLTDTPGQNDANLPGSNSDVILSVNPVTKAKKLWRQKTMLSKENLLTSPNLLAKFNGIHLNLNNGGICTLPVDILHQLTSLRMLYLDSNNLLEIPHELFTILKNLKWLDLRNNQLSTVPSSIKGHANLKTLLLQRNNIEELPLEIGLVPNLKNLQMAHNPLKFPPQEILDLDCSQIINFLRTEWNKQNPNETIELKTINNDKIEKKLSTILCFEPTSKRPSTKNKYNNYENRSKTSVRSRTWNYKPSNRCENNRKDIFVLHQKSIWINTAKKLLQDQTAELQKLTDKEMLDNWRDNRKLFTTKHTNALKHLIETPFALHTENLDENINGVSRSSKSKINHIDSRNFNENFKEIITSLKKLDELRVLGDMTPRCEQKKLQGEIEKITEMQRKLQNLKFYNDSAASSYNKTEKEVPEKEKYIAPPSIII